MANSSSAMQHLVPKQKNILTVAIVAALSVGLPRLRATEKVNTAKPAKAELPPLQLTVDVPPHWRPFLSDDLAEAFGSRLSDVFRQRGYNGEIEFLEHDDPKPDIPVLAVRLINWRIGRTDHAECAFTATLNSGGQDHSLGVFENTSLLWSNTLARWGLATALGDVADGALRDLIAKIGEAALLPGFPMGTSKN